MARRKSNKRKKPFKKKNVGIPFYMTGKETLENPCYICGGEVIYTGNEIVYNQPKGLGMCYYCTDCKALVLCKNKKEKLADGTLVYSPQGILGDKETRQLRAKCHQILDTKWRIQSTMKRSTAYRKLAVGMGIPPETCHFGWMNKEQIYYALDVLVLTEWTRNRFD